MILAVGTTTLRGSIENFGLDLLEVQVSQSMPRPSVLARYREGRPGLVLSLRLQVDGMDAISAHPELARAEEAARACSALAIVIATGPRFAPTEARRKDLASVVARLSGAARFIAWEPRGVWQPAESERWAKDVQAVLVRDLTQEDPPAGAIRYTRVRQLGVQSRITQGATESLLVRLDGADEAYIVVEGDGARNLRGRLHALFEGDGQN